MLIKNIYRLIADFWENLSENRKNRNITIAVLICIAFIFTAGIILKDIILFSAVSVLIMWLYFRFVYYQFFDVHKQSKCKFKLQIVSFVVTAIIIVLAYYLLGMFPAGPKCSMIVDMYHQYAPMLNFLRDSVINGRLTSYSFCLGTGANFLSVFAYYLASPLNAILLLFPENYLTEGILLITIIKICLCSFTFALFLQYTFKKHNLAIPVCSVLYALSAYTLAYSWNIMWLDSLIMLPIVTACLEHLVRTGKMSAYIAALAVTVYVNYYIGFMICIFLVMYFVASKICRTCKNGTDGCFVESSGGFFKFVLASLIGGGLAMFMILPTYNALKVTSAAEKSTQLSEIALQTNFDLFDIFGRGLFGTSPTVRSKGLPNIYCGVLTLLTAALFFMNHKINSRKKLAYGGMLALLIVSFSAKLPDLIWHGMHSPNDLPYRFSFIYCFIILTMSYQLLLKIKYTTLKQIAISFLGLIFLTVITEKTAPDAYEFIAIYGSIALFVAYSGLMYAYKSKKLNGKGFYSLLFFVVAFEALFNTNYMINTLNKNETYTSRNGYISSETSQLINESLDVLEKKYNLKSKNTFFRVETLPRLTLSDTALYNYPGITFFSSGSYYSTTRFMDTLGYRSNGINSVSYRNFVAPADALFGIKYLITDTKSNQDSLSEINMISGEQKNMYTYENTDILPFGFMADSEILDLDEFSDDYKYNPFEANNVLFSSMVGENIEIYDTENVKLDANEKSSCDIVGNSFILKPQASDSIYNFTVTAQKDDNYYLYVDCGGCTAITVKLPESTVSIRPRELYIINAGKLMTGQNIEVKITVSSRCSGNIYAATLDRDKFDYALSKLKSQSFEISDFADNRIIGSINCKTSGVMMTSVPYDESWKVYVDGKESKSVSVANAILGINLKEGIHTVEMRYIPKGIVVGTVISVLSAAAFVLIFADECKNNRKIR